MRIKTAFNNIEEMREWAQLVVYGLGAKKVDPEIKINVDSKEPEEEQTPVETLKDLQKAAVDKAEKAAKVKAAEKAAEKADNEAKAAAEKAAAEKVAVDKAAAEKAAAEKAAAEKAAAEKAAAEKAAAEKAAAEKVAVDKAAAEKAAAEKAAAEKAAAEKEVPALTYDEVINRIKNMKINGYPKIAADVATWKTAGNYPSLREMSAEQLQLVAEFLDTKEV